VSVASNRLRFGQPRLRPVASARSKYRIVAFVNGLQNAAMPRSTSCPDHRKPFDVGEVLRRLDVLHNAPAFQPWKPVHVEQHSQFPCSRTRRSDSGTKCSYLFCQLPADVNDENLPAVFFI